MVPKPFSGIFIGYEQQAGGAWNGGLRIIDWDEIENAENAGSIHIKRVGAKKVIVTK